MELRQTSSDPYTAQITQTLQDTKVSAVAASSVQPAEPLSRHPSEPARRQLTGPTLWHAERPARRHPSEPARRHPLEPARRQPQEPQTGETIDDDLPPLEHDGERRTMEINVQLVHFVVTDISSQYNVTNGYLTPPFTNVPPGYYAIPPDDTRG